MSNNTQVALLPPGEIAAVRTEKCIVKGCNNYPDEGGFVGDLCLPCHQMLTTGIAKHSATFVGSLFQQAQQLARFKTRLREFTKENQ